ncbi:MAG: sugar transferase [Microthrixaceae bacterium]
MATVWEESTHRGSPDPGVGPGHSEGTTPDWEPGPPPLAPGRRAKAALVIADLIATVAGLAVATQLYLLITGRTPLGVFPTAALALPVWPVVYAHQSLYQARRVASRLEEFRRLVNACLAGALLTAGLAFVLRDPLSRGWLALALVCVLATVAVEREGARRIFQRRRARGHLVRRVLVVGSNDEAREVAESLAEVPALGYDVVGFVATKPEGQVIDLRSGRPLGPCIGDPSDVVDLVRMAGANGVIVATTETDQHSANRLVRDLTREGVYVEMTAALRDIAPGRISVRPLGRYPVLCIEPVAAVSWRASAKRVFDVVVAATLLVLTSPVLVAAAVAVRVGSGRGVLFRQKRVGRDGRKFTLLKFRTMVPDAEQMLGELQGRNEAAGPMFKMADDPRVTGVGRVLRKFSIDELPQLWNVVRGDMSLVGPRPALPEEAAQWDDALRERLRVRPGITGMWQVSGRYTSSLETYARLDLFYVDNWSMVADLAILAKTVPVVLLHRGAA